MTFPISIAFIYSFCKVGTRIVSSVSNCSKDFGSDLYLKFCHINQVGSLFQNKINPKCDRDLMIRKNKFLMDEKVILPRFLFQTTPSGVSDSSTDGDAVTPATLALSSALLNGSEKSYSKEDYICDQVCPLIQLHFPGKELLISLLFLLGTPLFFGFLILVFSRGSDQSSLNLTSLCTSYEDLQKRQVSLSMVSRHQSSMKKQRVENGVSDPTLL